MNAHRRQLVSLAHPVFLRCIGPYLLLMACSMLGLAGVGLAMALGTAAQCGAVAVLFRRARRQGAEVSFAGAG